MAARKWNCGCANTAPRGGKGSGGAVKPGGAALRLAPDLNFSHGRGCPEHGDGNEEIGEFSN